MYVCIHVCMYVCTYVPMTLSTKTFYGDYFIRHSQLKQISTGGHLIFRQLVQLVMHRKTQWNMFWPVHHMENHFMQRFGFAANQRHCDICESEHPYPQSTAPQGKTSETFCNSHNNILDTKEKTATESHYGLL